MVTWAADLKGGSEYCGDVGVFALLTPLPRPDLKDGFKRNVKEMSTNARFSVFRTKKKLLRNL